MKAPSKKLFAITLTSLFVLTSLLQACDASKKQKKTTPLFVEAIVIQPVIWQPQIEATGTLKAEQGIMVKTEVAGKVSQIFFKPGQIVEKNTPLIQLNPDILKAQKSAAEANLTLKKMDFERFQALRKKEVASAMEYDKATAEYQSAQAAVAKANAELEQTLIRAPFGGQLGLNLVDLGDYVTPGTSVVSLQDTDPMYLDFYVPEVYLGKLKLGNTLQLKVEAYKDRIFKGKLSALNNQVDAETRMLEVRAEIPNTERLLLPGMFAEITLLLGERKPVIMIPKIALVATENGNMVYLISNQIAKKIPVITGEGDENHILVKEGLKAGDQIVTAGQLKLKEGVPVVVDNPNQNKKIP